MKSVINVAFRQQALFLPDEKAIAVTDASIKNAFAFVTNIGPLRYTVSEETFAALTKTSEEQLKLLYDAICDIKRITKNWTPLVKGWDKPTGERRIDHLITFMANAFGWEFGTTLPCGHLIPDGTFPLERYNGCPFCGKPFQFEELKLQNQGSKKLVLEYWTEKTAQAFLIDLLQAKTAPDATQKENISVLLQAFGLPDVQVPMKETAVLVIDYLVQSGQSQKAQTFFQTPADILRYLWFKHTGFIQMVEPKTILKKSKEANSGYNAVRSEAVQNVTRSKESLKLKYARSDGKMVASWMNNLELPAEKICEIMHPKRGIWVRMIWALRLAEHSKREGFEKLAAILDHFYKEDYIVWQGEVDKERTAFRQEEALQLLKERPGAFARALFANMLWFGPEAVVKAFSDVIDKVPARLVFTLNAYAKQYFEKDGVRLVKPLGGYAKKVEKHHLLKHYAKDDLLQMQGMIEDLCLQAMSLRFKAQATESKTIFIAPALYKIPVAIGDRSETVHDIPSALMGTSFPVEGDTVRLFMQWGTGLSAQHLDMDLSASIAFADGSSKFCSFSNLVAIGCKHSGDIQRIPEKIGTAEYIDINLPQLQQAAATYVLFTCNAYSMGTLSPNMVVGWMDSKFPMKISETSGVAYDPSCVQHQVRVTQNLNKGLVFGVLKVVEREITWLEMPFAGQLVQGVSVESVQLMLNKLSSKLNVGALLKLKAEAQGLQLLDTSTADENYTVEWVRNTAAVTRLLID